MKDQDQLKTEVTKWAAEAKETLPQVLSGKPLSPLQQEFLNSSKYFYIFWIVLLSLGIALSIFVIWWNRKKDRWNADKNDPTPAGVFFYGLPIALIVLFSVLMAIPIYSLIEAYLFPHAFLVGSLSHYKE